jgi:hypothetical protein
VVSASRVCPLIVAVAASALLVAGPASASPTADDPPCTTTAAPDGGETATCVPTESPAPAGPSSDTQAPGADSQETKPGQTGDGASSKKPGSSGAATGQGGQSDQGPSSSPGQDNGTPGGGPVVPGASQSPASGSSGPKPAGDKDCPDFATPQQAQQYFESIGGSATNDADRLDANHNGIACEDFFDDGDEQNATVTTTGDDGSKATTSGDQVTEVPEGSAQTGGN